MPRCANHANDATAYVTAHTTTRFTELSTFTLISTMGLSSFFQPKNADDAPKPAPRVASAVDVVERVRARARQRLIGAIVLVTVGVIGFPLVFESQPRPIAVDLPIDIARQDTAAPLLPPARRAPVASGRVEVPAAPATPVASEVAYGTAGPSVAGTPRPSSSSTAPMTPQVTVPIAVPIAVPTAASARSATTSATTFATTGTASATTSTSTAKPPQPLVSQPTPESIRAAATPAALSVAAAASPLAAASTADAKGAPRFVVQVGAFIDAAAVREVRLKMEKIGLKTYAQVAQTNAGKRTRVRLGPFATRGEADQALARARAAGVAAVVLTL